MSSPPRQPTTRLHTLLWPPTPTGKLQIKVTSSALVLNLEADGRRVYWAEIAQHAAVKQNGGATLFCFALPVRLKVLAAGCDSWPPTGSSISASLSLSHLLRLSTTWSLVCRRHSPAIKVTGTTLMGRIAPESSLFNLRRRLRPANGAASVSVSPVPHYSRAFIFAASWTFELKTTSRSHR